MTIMNTIPPQFTRTIVDVFKTEGIDWLERLPVLLAEYAERWRLSVYPPFEPLSYNYVAPAVQADGSQVVLKVGVPNPELQTEIEALRLYDGHGIVRLLEADPTRGAMLLERLTPGTPLVTLSDDEQATLIAAQVMRQLWRPVPSDHPFPSVQKWAMGLQRLREHFGGGTGPFPATLVEAAEQIFAELLASTAEPVLLHGDLHHWNILAAERQPWLAIDPKGVVGEPAYEVGALLRNPMPQIFTVEQPRRLLARRVDLLTDALGFDRARIVGWGFAQAVLSAWWTYEDHGQYDAEMITWAEHLATLVE